MRSHDTSEMATGVPDSEVPAQTLNGEPPPVQPLVDVLLELASNPNPDVRKPVLRHLGLTEPPQNVQGMPTAVRRHAEEFPFDLTRNASEEEVDNRLATFFLTTLAYSEHASVALLQELVSVPDPEVRRAVADQRNLPSGVQRALAQDKRWQVRESVAGNPHTIPEMLLELAGDEQAWVRFASATNPNIPVEALVRLAGDEEVIIRLQVAQSPKVADDDRLTLAVRLSAQFPGDPDGLEEAVGAVLV